MPEPEEVSAEPPPTITLVPDELERRVAYRLLTGIVTPRPIGWISTLSPEDVPNLAPFSFFNAVSSYPPVVAFSVSQARGGREKDTLRNAVETGEFVVNVVDETLAEQMNLTSGRWPPEVSEFQVAGLAAAPSVDVKPPRVAASPVAMEAKVQQVVPVEGTTNTLVMGRVVRFHLRADLLREDGLVDTARIRPIARLGGSDYARLGEVFSMIRPRVEPPPED
jgi:flavin reductase (DIM6/NTAB) family NADH-FMN oxidoreductase RutF